MATREPQPLTNLDDPRLDAFRDVVGRTREGLAVVEGAIPTERACACGMPVEAIVCTPSHVERLRSHIGEKTPWWVAPKTVLSSLLGFSFHRGVLAAVRVPSPSPLDADIIGHLARRSDPVVAVAVGVTDPANVGALVRAARALGVVHVLASADGADPFARKAVRASAGHVFSVGLSVCTDVLAETLRLRKVLGASLLVMSPAGDVSLRAAQTRGPRIVAFGSEGPGLPPTWMDAADARVRIPLAPEVDSLNVASAAAVAFYALGG